MIRLVPTSITVAPGAMKSEVIRAGFPIAAIRISRPAALLRQMNSARVADGHGGALGKQHQRHRLAHDVAASHHNRPLPLDGDTVILQQFDDPSRRARPRRRSARYQVAYVGRVKPIRILVWSDGFQHPSRIDLPGQRHLDQDPVNIGPAIQIRDDL